MKKHLKAIIFLLLTVAGIASMHAQVTVKAKLDSVTMLMGNVNTLNVEIVQDASARGYFPMFADVKPGGYATMLNDTLEFGLPVTDTVKINDRRIQINCRIPLQVFDSGAYRIPAIDYVTGRDTVRTLPLVLKVNPVKVTAEDKISPLTSVAPPENGSIFDALPDWLYYYWWAVLLGLGAIALTAWLIYRFRTKGVLLPQKAPEKPDVVALDRLSRLKARNLWQDGREKEFYTILTNILRVYLDDRFGIKAMEMPTSEILENLSEDASLRDSRSKMRMILDMADFVKFAKVRPLPDDNVKAFDNAVAFVEATRPIEETEDSATDNKLRKEGKA